MSNEKVKILLIEDEEMLANMYEAKFKNEGFNIEKALDGEEGLNKAKEILPDFILLDIIMPKMDGFAVLKALKEDDSTKNIPVILLTNLGQEEDMHRGDELGVVGYLVKANTTPSEVVETVKNKLNNK